MVRLALPIGPNKNALCECDWFLGRAWQRTGRRSWILNLTSGAPVNIQAQSMLYGNGVPDVCRAL